MYSNDKPPNIEVVVEVEAAIGTVLGAATSAGGYRRLVGKQGAGWLIAGGNRAGTTGVHHQVHPVEEAEGSEWEQQRNWRGPRGIPDCSIHLIDWSTPKISIAVDLLLFTCR